MTRTNPAKREFAVPMRMQGRRGLKHSLDLAALWSNGALLWAQDHWMLRCRITIAFRQSTTIRYSSQKYLSGRVTTFYRSMFKQPWRLMKSMLWSIRLTRVRKLLSCGSILSRRNNSLDNCKLKLRRKLIKLCLNVRKLRSTSFRKGWVNWKMKTKNWCHLCRSRLNITLCLNKALQNKSKNLKSQKTVRH